MCGILLNSYTEIDDIERALENELNALDQKILVHNGNIKSFTRLLVDKQSLAARNERLGKEISQKLLDEIKDIKNKVCRTFTKT